MVLRKLILAVFTGRLRQSMMPVVALQPPIRNLVLVDVNHEEKKMNTMYYRADTWLTSYTHLSIVREMK